MVDICKEGEGGSVTGVLISIKTNFEIIGLRQNGPKVNLFEWHSMNYEEKFIQSPTRWAANFASFDKLDFSSEGRLITKKVSRLIRNEIFFLWTH